MTHSGLPKNITFEPFEENINLYKDKIDIIYYDNVYNKKEYPSYNLFGVVKQVKEIQH